MQSVTIIAWRTSDDQLWDDEKMALRHEALLKERATIIAYAQHMSPDNARNQARIVSTVEKYISFRTEQGAIAST